MSAAQREERPVGIVVGASNVTRCIGPVVCAAADALGGRADLRIVAGRGRSFGTPSRVLIRSLPSIALSPVWREFGDARVDRALITDIGNDIMYGHAPETILDWVAATSARCREFGAALTIVRLPLARLRRLRVLPYEIVRTALFARHGRFPLAEAIRRVEAVDDGLVAIAARHDATLVTPDSGWYGVDPIHIRLRCATVAWRTIFASWVRDGDAKTNQTCSRPLGSKSIWSAHLRLTCTMPASARIAGVAITDPVRAATPVAVCGGDVVVRLY